MKQTCFHGDQVTGTSRRMRERTHRLPFVDCCDVIAFLEKVDQQVELDVTVAIEQGQFIRANERVSHMATR